MLLIHCPWCGERHQSEFTYGGEARIPYPVDPDSVSDEDWAGYLFMRKNPKGCQQERWLHGFGCRRWFNAVRHTVTDEFWAVYKIGEEPPVPPENWDGIISKEEHEAVGKAGESK